MRIARGKSNLEVSSRGFALFVVGLILATFFGGGIRVGLKSERIHQRLVRELHERFPQNDVQVGQTEILLARGIWPGLALRAFDVSFAQDSCGKLSFLVTAPVITVPVDIWSVIWRRPRLGSVVVDRAKLRLDYHDCLIPRGKAMSSSEGLRETVRARGIQPPKMAWREISRKLSGVELNQLELTYERNLTWKVLFEHARIDLDSEMTFDARAELIKAIPGGSLHHSVQVAASGEENDLNWQIKTAFKEGEIAFGGKWDLVQNSIGVKAQLTQLPLKELSSELFQMGFIARDIKLRAAWLTGALNWEGSAAHIQTSPIRLHGCKLEGAYGRIDFAEGEVNPSEPEVFLRPAKFLVQNLQVQPLLEALGKPTAQGVFTRLGLWTGTMDYKGPKSWRLDGELNSVEMMFSNLSVRGKQAISHVHTEMTQSESGLDALVDRALIGDGLFDGRIDVHFSPTGLGEFELNLKQLGFGSNIQGLLFGGPVAPIEAHAQGKVAEGGEIVSLKATAKSRDIQGSGWRGEGLEAEATLGNGLLRLDANVVRAEADARWRLYPQLRVTGRASGEPLAWRDLKAHVEFTKTGGTLTSLSATENAKPTPWRARGSWVRDGLLSGTLLIGQGARALSYRFTGERGGLSIVDRGADQADKADER